MQCLRSFVLVLAIAGICRGGEATVKPDPKAMAQLLLEYHQEQTAIYRTITDAKTAEAAKPRIMAMERKMGAGMAPFMAFANDKMFDLEVKKASKELGVDKAESEYMREMIRVRKLPEAEAALTPIRREAKQAMMEELTAQLKKSGVDLGKLDKERRERKPEPLTPELATAILGNLKDDASLLYPTRETVRRQLEAKVGDWVKLRDSGVEMQTLKRSGSEKYTVESVDADGLTISRELDLQWENKPQKRNTTDRFHSAYDTVLMRGPFLMVNAKFKTASGEETLRVGDKAYKCTWVETREKQQNGAVMTMRTWICPEAPLFGALKQIRTMDALGLGQTDHTVVEVIEFGSAATGPAKRGAKE